MKRRTVLIAIFILLLLISICILAFFKFKEKKDWTSSEIVPLEELTEEQERQTLVTLYFTNPDNNTLVPEVRKIDAKKLLENPYKLLIELIIENPKNERLRSSIPEGTKVLEGKIKDGIVTVNLSKDFIENQTGDEEAAKLSVYAIVNTLSELNEVNKIKILIEGEDNKKFNNIDFSLKDSFERKN